MLFPCAGDAAGNPTKTCWAFARTSRNPSQKLPDVTARRNPIPVPTESGSLTVSQGRVLSALACGGLLTKDQIRRSASLTRWEVGRALSNLSSRHLIAVRSFDRRWSITDLGRSVASRPRRRARDATAEPESL